MLGQTLRICFSKDKTTTGEGAGGACCGSHTVRSQFLFLSFFVSTIFLKEKSTGGGMRRWEKGQRLTLGASWGSHAEESGSVTLLALLADMDSCLQARTPHCTSISTEATFLSIVHGVYSAIWRALVHCTWSAQWSPCPAGWKRPLCTLQVHLYTCSALYSAQLVGRGNQPRRAGRNCTSCLIIVAAIIIFFLFAVVIFSVLFLSPYIFINNSRFFQYYVFIAFRGFRIFPQTFNPKNYQTV